ncbi:MAG: fibronectin type III domain-containing protein, partial [Spirochaetes bacterium]|nr:fibronectin type III domain-containing protein [Spirochaetota bacterium]
SVFSNTITNMIWNVPADVGSGITNYLVRATNTDAGWSTNVWTSSTNITGAAYLEGNYYWRIYSFDRAWNYSISVTNHAILDLNPPSQIILIMPTNNFTTNGAAIDLLWNSATDTITGVSNYFITVTNLTGGWSSNIITLNTNYSIGLSAGTFDWFVHSRDRAGHWSIPSATNRFYIDIAGPFFTNLSPTNNQINVPLDADVIFNVFDNVSVISQSTRVRIAGLTALSNGSFLPGYTGSITVSNSGWNVVLNSLANYPAGALIGVYAVAEDTAGNTNDISWQFTTAQVPSDPVWISAVPVATNRIDLLWWNLSNETSYTVYRSTGNNTNTATNIIGTLADVTNLNENTCTPDTTYYYWLKAFNTAGGSGFSASISAATPPAAPDAPVFISATPVSSVQIDLLWYDLSNETSYSLFRNTGNFTNSATNITGSAINITNYNNISLLPDTSYFYWLKAYNGGGPSPFSTYISNRTLQDSTAPLPDPAQITAVALSPTSIRWTAVAGTDPSPPITYQFNGSMNTNTNIGWALSQDMTLTSLNPNTWYTQRVRMRDAYSNTGAWSVGYVGRYTHAYPPVNGQIIPSNGQLLIAWEANNNPTDTEYYVERARDENFIEELVILKDWSIGTTVSDGSTSDFKTYYYRIVARNHDGILSQELVITKQALYEAHRRFRNSVIKYKGNVKVEYHHLFEKDGYVEAIIYDITGAIVKKFDRMTGKKGEVQVLMWDGKDGEGKYCGPGYYIFYVKPDKERYRIVIW